MERWRTNESAFCIGAHTATAGRRTRIAKVQAVLADLDSAP
jgi:hypothetical protein